MFNEIHFNGHRENCNAEAYSQAYGGSRINLREIAKRWEGNKLITHCGIFIFFLIIHTGGRKLSFSKSLTISYTVLYLKLIIDLDLG